jgi:hypothetical protein
MPAWSPAAYSHLFAQVHVALLDGDAGLRAVETDGRAAGLVAVEAEALEAAVVAEQEVEFLARANAVQRGFRAGGGVHHFLQVGHVEAAGSENVRQRLPRLHPHHLPVVHGGGRGVDRRDLGQRQRQQRMCFRCRRGTHRAGPGGHDETGQQGDQQRGAGEHQALAVPADRFDLARAIERPVRPALVEMGVPTLCLATDRLLAGLPSPLLFFCHAVHARATK